VWRPAPPRDLSGLRWAPISSPIMPLPQLRLGLQRPAPLDGSGGEVAAVARKGGLLTSLAATTRLQESENEDAKQAEADGKVSRKRGRAETKEEKARVKRKEKRVQLARRASRRKTYKSEAKKVRKRYEQAVARYERLAEKSLRKLRRNEVDHGQIGDEREAELRLLGDQREALRGRSGLK